MRTRLISLYQLTLIGIVTSLYLGHDGAEYILARAIGLLPNEKVEEGQLVDMVI